ncbi:hypothetical protein HDU67_003633 [Dinochytrium kinnereticum]|nr:hypothetical protein HDU67_003633 [Dinochytrium kinnereticum]
MRSLAVRVVAIGTLLALTLFSLSIWPATADGQIWEMAAQMIDFMDINFILANFLPPAILILSCILFLDTLPGHSRDVDVAMLTHGDTSKAPRSSLWQARWRLAMGKVIGNWSVGEIMMVVALVVCNFLWWFVPVISRMRNPPAHAHVHGNPTPLRKTFNSIAGWAGWAGMWDGGAAILFAIRDNHLLKKTLGPDAGQYHRMIRFHVGLGYACLFLETFHSLYFMIAYAIDNKFERHMYPWVAIMGYWNGAGFISWVALVAVSATSIFRVRRKNYRVFYWTHQLYVVFILFSLIHYYGRFTFVGPLLYFAYDRLAPSLRTNRNTVAHLHPLTPTLLRVDIPIPKSHTVLTQYAPGDWINLNVPSISSLNWHPFSIASYNGVSKDRLTVYIKARGDWTTKLRELAVSGGEPVKVKVDGPFGAKSTTYLDFEHLVLVGGGTGMAALIPFARHYASRGAGSLHIVWIARSKIDLMAYGDFMMEVKAIVGSSGSVKVFVTRPDMDVELYGDEKKMISTLLASESSGFLVAGGGDVKKVDGVVEQPTRAVDDSVDNAGVAVTSSDTGLYFRALFLNILLVIATFGGGVGGYVFARTQGFGTKMKLCDSRTAHVLPGLDHFLCWYWLYMGPVVMPVAFSLLMGFAVLLLKSFLIPTPASVESYPRPEVTVATRVPDGVVVKEGRPDFMGILDAVGGGAAVMAAGPERMVLEVQRCAGERGVWFFRESFKV